ncbi:WD40 repeat domain-containing protein [bacterium]|nr:WD40 repeat domain-containing protein [bacterium]
MKKIWIIGVGVLFWVLSLAAVGPQKFELEGMRDFLEGKFKGVSVSYDGYLSLAPKDESLEGPPEEFYLSFLLTSEGAKILGTGHSGKIYKVSEEGKVSAYFKVPEMDIYCLVEGPKGNIFAGSSPNGKIYKITEQGKGEVFFDPPEKYIWDLMISEDGSLRAAVGERGGIYRVSLEGEGKKILEAEENHILCMKEDSHGNLIAGSGGQGLIYQITPTGKTSVLFESPYEEIKSISLDEKGYIYAAAGGKVTASNEGGKAVSLAEKAQTDLSVTVKAAPEKTESLKPNEKGQPSTLYRISPQKNVRTLWHSENELIYSLFWDAQEKKVLLGTGNQGRLYAVDSNKKASLLLQKSSQQVYSFYPSDSGIYVISNNPSSLSLLSRVQRFKGEYVSEVLDARILSKWGKIGWEADVPSGTTLQFQTRSGNSREPNKAWSEWSPPYQKTEGEQILSPKGRYLQFKVMFKSQSGKVSPGLRKLSLFYLQSNVSPRFTKLEVLSPNVVYLKPPPQEEKIWGVEEKLSQEAENNKNKTYSVGKKVHRKGFQTMVWEAVDKNQDNLLYNLYIREENKDKWRILKKSYPQKIFAFDTLSFPDGVYKIKLEASDSPSNPAGTELKEEKVSRAFKIDNSLPQVVEFQAVREKNQLEVNFTAVDSMSYIKEVKYLIRPHGWRPVFPEDGICDSKQERFRFTLSLSSETHNLITVKVKDSQGNVGVYRETL